MNSASRLTATVLVAIIALSFSICSRLMRRTAPTPGISFARLAMPADTAIFEAARRKCLWLNTRAWREQALAAYLAQHRRAALRLLTRATTEARLAINQRQIEEARYWLMRHEAYVAPAITRWMTQLEDQVRAHDGPGAESTLRVLRRTLGSQP